MQNLIVRLRPDCFEDIIALVALFRPGPLESGMVDNFIARKHGKEKVSYPDAQYQHDSLKEILEPTYGVILYQEQVMQIAQVLAGYTLGGADMLRRAMGKKKPEEMAKQRSIFKEGAINNHVDGDLAMKIFDLVEKFAGYGFNKSHSAAYALVSYQSAWLKTHFPAEFMAAQISSDMDTTDKVVHMVNECHAMGIGVAKPSINEGEIHVKAIRGERKVRYGLGAIKGVGESALHGIIEERNQHGHYQDLFDFCLRVTRKVNKRVIEALIVAGAMDCLHDNRNAMLHTVGLALQKAEQQHKNEEAGQADLFGDVSTFVEENRAELVAVPELSEKQRLKAEKDVLGLYMTGHPIEIYRQELDKMVDQKLSALRPEKWQKKWVAGLIVEARSKVTKSGNRMGFLAIDDRTARLDVVLRAAVFESSRDLLVPDSVVLVYGEVAEDTFNGGIKFDAEQLVSLAEARIEKARAIKLYSDQSISIEQIHAVATVLSAYRAEQGLPLVVDYQNSQAKVQLKSEANNVFVPDDELLEALRAEGWQLEVVY